MHMWRNRQKKRDREKGKKQEREREREPESGRAVRLRIVFPFTIDLFVNRAAPPPDVALSLSLFLFLYLSPHAAFRSLSRGHLSRFPSSSCSAFVASRTFSNRTSVRRHKKDLSHLDGGVTVTSPSRTFRAYGSPGAASSQG